MAATANSTAVPMRPAALWLNHLPNTPSRRNERNGSNRMNNVYSIKNESTRLVDEILASNYHFMFFNFSTPMLVNIR